MTKIITPLVTLRKSVSSNQNDGAIDLSEMYNLLDYISPYSDGFLIGLSTGNGENLTINEIIELIRVISIKAGDKKLYVGFIDKDINQIKELLSSNYFKYVTGVFCNIEGEKEEFILKINELRSLLPSNMELFLYLNDVNSRVGLTYKDISDLVSDNVIQGIKDSSTKSNNLYDIDKTLELKKVNHNLQVYSGLEIYFNPSFNYDGCIFSLSNIEPKLISYFVKELRLNNKFDLFRRNVITPLYHFHNQHQKDFSQYLISFLRSIVLKKYEELDFRKAFHNLFEIYSEEPAANLHVKHFDIKNPLKSTIKTLMSDLLSLQVITFKDTYTKGLIFFPISIELIDNNNKTYSSFQLENDSDEIFHEANIHNYHIEHEILLNDWLNKIGKLKTDNKYSFPLRETTNNEEIIEIKYKSNEDAGEIDIDVKVVFSYNPNYDNVNLDLDVVKDIFFIAGFTKRNVGFINKLKEKAIQTAKAAIMGRNMSHNIGSHVLYYLKDHLSSVTQMVRDRIVLQDIPYKVVKDGDYEYISLGNESKALNSIELPFLKGLGRFLTYLQERQDFIATIASSYNPSLVSVNFKDFIIDNFTADKRAERHGSELKREKNILLQYLAKSEDISVEIHLNGKSLASKGNIGEELRNIEVDVPGGVLGRQAFYSILENIIRNAAKHGKPQKGQSLILNIALSQLDEEYYQVVITDNNIESGKHAAEVDKMLDEELIDEHLKLIEHHKGIKEIKISALWLLGLSLSEITNEERRKYLRVENVGDQLAYVFKLFSSQKLAIIADQIPAQIEATATTKSISYFNVEEVESQLGKIKKYNLVVNSTKQENDKLRKGVKRYVHYDKESINQLIANQSEIAYSNAYLTFLQKNYPELQTFQPIICTDKLESGYAAQELKVSNLDLLKWIENDGNSFVKIRNEKEFPMYYDTKLEGKVKRIAFKRHFKEQNELKNFFGDNFQPDKYTDYASKKEHIRGLIDVALENYYSIESITGDNSTIRILYNEEKNDEWILKCVETALSQILILDERLWNNNCFYSPPKQNNLGKEIIVAIESQINNDELYEFDLELFRTESNFTGNIGDERENQLLALLNEYNMNEIVEGYNPALFDDLKEQLKKKIFLPESKEKYKIYTPTSFELNGISISNINRIERGKDEITMCDLFGDEIIRITNIIEPNNISIEIVGSKTDFHYLSVHQGILDKIFNQYKDLMDYSGESGRLTKEDFIPYVLKTFRAVVKPKKLSLHSGRSKPYILPQGVSFIPFSGIEYGITESKQVLLNIILSAESEGTN